MKRILLAAAAGATTALLALPATPAEAQPGGSYQQSCRRVRDVGNPRNPVLAAQCRDGRGRWQDTTLAYRGCRGDIVNANGRLTCAGGGNGGGPGWGGGRPDRPDRPGRLPAGSWQRTCEPREWSGSVLVARCENGNRGREISRLDVRSCRSGRVANAYGRLVCE